MSESDAGDRSVTDDDRAVTVSDTVATGTIIVITVVLAAGLGYAVLTDAGDVGPPEANFTFQYFSENGALIVTHSRGDEIEAGNLVLTDGETSASWATVAGTNDTTMIGSGDTIQLSARSSFGAEITPSDRVQVKWVTSNQTEVLATWRDSGF
jgi:hypothetical protein